MSYHKNKNWIYKIWDSDYKKMREAILVIFVEIFDNRSSKKWLKSLINNSDQGLNTQLITNLDFNNFETLWQIS